MLYQPDFTQQKLRTYEQIGHRIQQVINDPRVQKLQFVTIARLPNENPADWRRLLNEIAGTAGIKIEAVEDGAYKVGWREYCEYKLNPPCAGFLSPINFSILNLFKQIY